jgi:hypothetical protein
MSWYDPSSWGQGGQDPNQVRNRARGQLNTNAWMSENLANGAQQNYDASGAQLGNTYGQLGSAMNHLGGVMRGENSVSREQLRQGLQSNMSAQRSMAASASPQNGPMAALMAAQNMGRMGAGMSGQAALAGIQERNAAAGQYGQLGQAMGQLQLGARGQDVQAALGARQNAQNAYGAMINPNNQNQGTLERNAKLIGAVGGAIMGA